jgi:predicted porin
MKKTLFALAAVSAFAGTAQAQSSVTVYGIVDAGMATVTNTTSTGGATTGVQSGGLASPRLGLKGLEDIGGGSGVGFVLEAELLTANGASNGISGSNTKSDGSAATTAANQFFNRASYVSYNDKAAGEFRLGLMNTSSYDYQIAYDPLAAANVGGFLNGAKTTTITNTNNVITASTLSNRTQNAVAYVSPTFGGFQLRANAGTNQGANQGDALVAGKVSSGRVFDAGLKYDWQKLSVAVANQTLAQQATVSTGATNYSVSSGAALAQMSMAAATYDFGIAKVYGIYSKTANKIPNISSTMSYLTRMVGVTAPVTSNITLGASYTTTVNGNANGTTAGSANTGVTALMAKYALSKRSSLYALTAMSSNGAAGAAVVSDTKFTGATAPLNQTGSTTGTYGNQTAIMVGINHTF